ncbi:MAG: tRNA (N(6)-L-threonylcarbamoyladenosine(37)-C(2))-methylthiotransferase MtaB [Alphaproteobacteria bacterium]|nr:tRNA (N(6)-L-threonylcarbamoyladenosine(37)-C(2))-methylthiotransferase MtaB [Alphaproteobacteria bacterium]
MVEVVTLGCRINSFESEILKEKFRNVDDLVIINTCAVTKEAERQCRQVVRKLRAQNPNSRIVVTGCAAQVNADSFAKMDEVDLVLGNKEKTALEQYIKGDLSEKSIVGDIMSYDGYDDYIITGFEGRHKAFVQIQQGCDHRCTYCIVPFARGANRSVPSDKILTQISTLLSQGFEAICLTGVDVCSYKPSFSGLIRQILETFPELPSLQFGSLDPAAIDDEFIEIAGKFKNMLPMFHFSIQSGDDTVLKRMGRRHRRKDIIDLCRKIKKVRDDAVFGADFICGFPGESEENFNNTLKLVDEAGLSKLHVFPYSERPGTPAARWGQIDMEIRRERARILRLKGEEKK